MKLRKWIVFILTIALFLVATMVPVFAASATLTAGSVASDGTVVFTFTVTDSTKKVGSIDVDLSATGGTIIGVSTSSNNTITPWGGSHVQCGTASSPNSLSFTVTCKMSGNSMSLKYSGLAAGDGAGEEDLSLPSSSGSATATAPATTAAPTAAPKTTASTAANLKSLSVSGYTLSPKFSANRTSYTVQVPKDATSLDVKAIALNGDANVTVTGDKNFTAGKSNTVKIAVKGSDGTTKTYTIKTVFEAETTVPVKKDVNLTGLTLKAAQDVNFNFDPAVYTYNITVPKGTTSLDVNALAEGVEGAKIDVKGADDLVASGNVVVITVTGADGSTSEYTLNVAFASDEQVAPVEKKSGAPIWLVIVLSLLFLIIGFVIGFIIGKKRGGYDDGGDDDDNGGSGFVFGQSADEEPAPVAPASTGFNFSGMSFNPPVVDNKEPEAAPLAPPAAPIVTPEVAVPLNANIPTPAPAQPAAPVYAPTPAYTPAPAAPVVAEPVAAPLYTPPVAEPQPTYTAPAAPAYTPAAPTPAYTPAPTAPVATVPVNEEPIYVAPSLPYQPGATLTDENIVQPAPKVIKKNPFEQCAD